MSKSSGKVPTEKPVVIIRRKAGTKSSLPGPAQPPRVSEPIAKPAAPATAPPPLTESQPPVLLQPPVAPEVAATEPSKKEQEWQACRALLDVMRQRWPQTFPRDFTQLRPWALGLRHALVAHLAEHPPRRVGAAIGMYKRFTGPAYFRALLRGGPRYDLEGTPSGEVTPEEQEQAKRDLAGFYERRKKNATPRTHPPYEETAGMGMDENKK